MEKAGLEFTEDYGRWALFFVLQMLVEYLFKIRTTVFDMNEETLTINNAESLEVHQLLTYSPDAKMEAKCVRMSLVLVRG